MTIVLLLPDAFSSPVSRFSDVLQLHGGAVKGGWGWQILFTGNLLRKKDVLCGKEVEESHEKRLF